MSLNSALARGRRAAEARMIDRCEIKHKTGETTNPTTGKVTPVYTTVYTGKCRVMAWNVATTSPNVGQQRVDLLRSALHVPVDVAGVQVNDIAVITASRDPDLVGRTLRIENLAHKTDGTARRFPVEEVVS